MDNPKEYTNNLINDLNIYTGNNNGYGVYEGSLGALRVTKEYAYGLKDFNSEVEDCIQNSYGNLYVKFYDLKLPISAK